MSAPFVLAVPSKGRLQENAEAFFARAGLQFVKPRGAREYRGTIADIPGVEVAYLSASDITAQLGHGAAHFGVTGEDEIREVYADAEKRVVLIDTLGFGQANVAVAVPQAWIDVRTMSGLDDVATAFRAAHDRKMASPRRAARAFREVHTRAPGIDEAVLGEAKQRFGVAAPFGGPTSSGLITLHCPPAQAHALASFLRGAGAEASWPRTSIACLRETIRCSRSWRRGSRADQFPLVPAKAGTQLLALDSRLRGNERS
jgi:ATP phosphoribosyltransferase